MASHFGTAPPCPLRLMAGTQSMLKMCLARPTCTEEWLQAQEGYPAVVRRCQVPAWQCLCIPCTGDCSTSTLLLALVGLHAGTF
jgi:hypothetical protein